MRQYFIRKSCRVSNTPYIGPTCDQAGIQSGKIYTDRIEAENDAKKLSKHNPVGFVVDVYSENN